MKTWKRKVKLNKPHGICTVKEASDKDCSTKRFTFIPRGCTEEVFHSPAPRSHGFVNLFHDRQYVGFCGVHYAETRQINSKGKYITKPCKGNR